MRDTEEATTGRSKQPSDSTLTGVELRPDQMGQVAECVKKVDGTWIDTLGDWIESIGHALEGLDLGDISFD